MNYETDCFDAETGEILTLKLDRHARWRGLEITDPDLFDELRDAEEAADSTEVRVARERLEAHFARALAESNRARDGRTPREVAESLETSVPTWLFDTALRGQLSRAALVDALLVAVCGDVDPNTTDTTDDDSSDEMRAAVVRVEDLAREAARDYDGEHRIEEVAQDLVEGLRFVAAKADWKLAVEYFGNEGELLGDLAGVAVDAVTDPCEAASCW